MPQWASEAKVGGSALSMALHYSHLRVFLQFLPPRKPSKLLLKRQGSA